KYRGKSSHRWGRLRLYRFPGSVLTDYRILKNYAKTLTGAGV
ncbi:YlcG family protein, partial [Escherichia coli]